MKILKLKNFIAAICFAVLLSASAFGQLSLSEAASTQTIDFSTTIAGVNNGSYTGTGFSPTPAVGQLDSDAWAVTGLQEGDLAFGGTQTGGDFALGSTTGGVGTGGIYNLNPNVAIWLQPTNPDLTPGTITLRIQNNGTSNITSFAIAYDILVLNDQPRSNSFNFAYSSDNVNYTPVPALNYVTPSTADGLGVQTVFRATTISGISIAPGGFFYLRWITDDAAGGGNRDEIGIDNIAVRAFFAPVTAGEVFVGGRVMDVRGMPIANATVMISGGPLLQPRVTRTSGFGFFGFRNVSVGNTYVISVTADRYSFDQPSQVISVNDEQNGLLFVGTRFFGTTPERR